MGSYTTEVFTMSIAESELIAGLDQFFSESARQNRSVYIWFGSSRTTTLNPVLKKECFLPVANLEDAAAGRGHVIGAHKK